ncbi:Uncharacterized protein Fot_19826 [Forsythia ovata]|uniref:Uncharacterized protein n=1 Tax=Forsythia ovata TaxID=205694 RepID=A0ABD1VM59_9LAMI
MGIKSRRRGVQRIKVIFRRSPGVNVPTDIEKKSTEMEMEMVGVKNKESPSQNTYLEKQPSHKIQVGAGSVQSKKSHAATFSVESATPKSTSRKTFCPICLQH